MAKDIRAMYTEFDERSGFIFFQLFNEFRNEADKIETGENNVFNLMRSRYGSLLRQRVEKIATNLIEECETPDLQGRLRIFANDKIQFYLKEFTRKSMSM
jgi:hypothetical protein